MVGKQVCFTSNCANDTWRLAKLLAGQLGDGDVVALEGELGTGKTQMAKALAAALGIQEAVTSPTFGLVMEYPRPDGGWFFHLDMYRLDSSEQALAFGIEDYLFAATAITVVEWPERIIDLLRSLAPENPVAGRLWHIRLEHNGEDCRNIFVPLPLGQVLSEEC